MTASGGTGIPSPDTGAEHCTHASSLSEQAGPLPTSCHWRSRPAKPGQPLDSGRSPCATATPRGRQRGDASSQGSGARARRPPGNGRQGGRGPVPSRALHASSPSGAQPVSQPQPRASHLVAEAAGSQQVRAGRAVAAHGLLAAGAGQRVRHVAQRLGPRGRQGLGGPARHGALGSGRARRRRRFLLQPASAGSPSAPAEAALDRRPSTSGVESRRRRRHPPAASARAGLGRAGLLRSEPRRAPPLGTRACGGSARTLARAPGPQRHAAQPARGPAPAAPGGPGRGRGRGRGERGRGGEGEAVSSVPARRPAGSAPPALCGGRASVQARLPEAGPLGSARTPRS